MLVIEVCDKHKVKLVGFDKPFCKFCRKDTEGNREGKRVYNFHRTFLSKKIQGETIEISGDIVNSMTFTPAGTTKRISVCDILLGQEKVRITITDPILMREMIASKSLVVSGLVRHNMKHIDEACDDLLVMKLQDIT